MNMRLTGHKAIESNPRPSTEWRRFVREGASWALVLGLLALSCILSYVYASPYGAWAFLIGAAALVAASVLVGTVLVLLGKLVGKLPTPYLWILTSFFILFLVVILYSLSALLGMLVLFLAVVLGLSSLGAGVSSIARHGWGAMSRVQRSITGAGLILGVTLLALVAVMVSGDGTPLERSALTPPEPHPGVITASDPTLKGPYPVRTLTYGSGNDRRRPEYGDAVQLTTPTLDLSPFVSGWSTLRTRYWGFGPDSVPLNALVWYPQGEGPFPLVLMVHGNAEMTRGSDRGYEYLGELLASRGFIFASVDQNFLNSSAWADLLLISSLSGENDARAIVLLEHLSLWRAWNETPNNPFCRVTRDDLPISWDVRRLDRA